MWQRRGETRLTPHLRSIMRRGFSATWLRSAANGKTNVSWTGFKISNPSADFNKAWFMYNFPFAS